MTVPAVPVDAYAADLAQLVADALVVVLPYAAAMTAFVIGLRMLKRWLGHRAATSLGSSPSAYGQAGDWKKMQPASYDEWDSGDFHQDRFRARRAANPGYGNRHQRKRGIGW